MYTTSLLMWDTSYFCEYSTVCIAGSTPATFHFFIRNMQNAYHTISETGLQPFAECC